MRHAFYTMVEMITERITEIENGHIKLGEFYTYMSVSRDVTIVSNIVIALMIPVVIAGIVMMCKFFGKIFDKIYDHFKKESLA